MNNKKTIKIGFLFFILISIFYLNSCTSTPVSNEIKKDSLSVTLNTTDEMKLEIFQTSIIQYFRRYTPTLQNDNSFHIQYGKYPVIASFEDNKVFIESTIPHKHPLWLSNVSKLMREMVN